MRTRRLRRGWAIFVAGVALVTVAACTAATAGHGTRGGAAPRTSSASPTTPPAQQPTISFTDCRRLINLKAAGISDSRAQHLSFECGKLDVPANYANPTAGQISIFMVKIHKNDSTQHLGSLLVNPGGPGGQGSSLAVGLAGTVSDDLLDRFDLVGFDPRGVGLSSPVECISDSEKDRLNALTVDVRKPAGFEAAKAEAARVANACADKYGTQLAVFNTVNTAKDMDRIRRALGDSSMNYLGFSYGTLLGAVFAHLFPKTIRVAVLDGAVDPRESDISSFANQVEGFEKAFDQFAKDCLTRSDCQQLGDPRAAVMDLVKKAEQAPIPSSNADETRKATGALILTGVISALYSQDEWDALGKALIDAQKGDSAGILALADEYNQRDSDGHYTNLQDANLAISCNDEKSAPTDAQIRTTAAEWAHKYPLFGLWSASSLFSCQDWQNNRTPIPNVHAVGAPPILVVGTIHDPATPYANTASLASQLGTGVVLTYDGQGHTAYGKSNCIDDKVNAYLIDKTVPAPHTSCPA